MIPTMHMSDRKKRIRFPNRKPGVLSSIQGEYKSTNLVCKNTVGLFNLVNGYVCIKKYPGLKRFRHIGLIEVRPFCIGSVIFIFRLANDEHLIMLELKHLS